MQLTTCVCAEPMVEEVDAACADVAHHEPEAKWAFSHSGEHHRI